jgi:hypothetical protein
VQCVFCEKTFSRYDIHLCPICHKKTCEKCATSRGGKHFCSQYCAEYFFFAGDDDDAYEE